MTVYMFRRPSHRSTERRKIRFHSSDITVTDMFCGCGGSSLGASQVPGVVIYEAINHWRQAVQTHSENFPGTRHTLTDIQTRDPKRHKRTTILIASPSCTNHSIAKGKRRIALAQELPWDGDYEGNKLPESAEERSRCTMWDPLRWTREHQYEYILLENVVDAVGWAYSPLWLQEWRDMGYEFQTIYLNSMFFHPTPQNRDRWYFVAWRKGNRAPNLTFHPQAYCQKCDKLVGAVQAWKKKRRGKKGSTMPDAWGRYGERRQYLYRCPYCTEVVTPYYYAAANAIDWSLPTQKIGERKKPLEPKTMARIEEGLRRFTKAQPFALQVNKSDNRYTNLMEETLPTQTGSNGQALVSP